MTRVCHAQTLLTHLRDKKRWTQTVTGDESWVYFGHTSVGQWVFPEEDLPRKVPLGQEAEKRMLIVFFSSSGFHSVNFLEKKATVSSSYCCDLFNTMALTLTKRPLWVHMDNARPHRAKSTQNALNTHGIISLPHPPYSPDLAPSDFWLFGYLKNQLKGAKFSTETELQEAVRGVLHKITPAQLRRVYNHWIRRLEMCIEAKGEYIHNLMWPLLHP